MNAAPEQCRRPAPQQVGTALRCALAALGVAVSVADAAAAGSEPADSGAAPVEIGTVDLETLLEMPIGAVSLHEERADLASAAVWVLGEEDIRLQGFRTLQEALRSVPGLFAYRDGYYPLVGVRGLGLLGDQTTRILVLVDGHPVNNSVGLMQSYVGRDLPVPIDAVKRIEVVKGPVGSIYGPTAFEAVVSVVTRGADDGPASLVAGGEAAQGRALAGTASAHAGARAGQATFLVAAEAFGSRGYDFRFPELLADDSRPPPPGGVVSGADEASALTAYAKVSWRGVRALGGCNRSAVGLPTAPYSSNVGDPGNEAHNQTCFAEVAFEREAVPGVTVLARASYDEYRSDDAFRYPPPPQSYGTYRDVGADRWLAGELRLSWRPSPAGMLMAGARVEGHDTLQHSYAEGVPTVIDDPDGGVGVGEIRKRFGTLNAYLLAEYAVVRDVLRVEGGLTLYEHELFGQRVTPKAAVVWSPGASDVVKVVYSEGFRAPSLFEALFEDGTDFAANPDLEPETVRAAEVGWQRRLGRVASVGVSLFHNEYRNLIGYQTVPDPALGRPPDPSNPADYRQMALNSGTLSQRGGELTVNLDWGPKLRAWGGLSAQQLGGEGVPNFPVLTGNAALSTRALWRPLALTAGVSAGAGREKDPDTLGPVSSASVGPYLVLSAGATIDVPGVPGLSIQLAAVNLLGWDNASPLPGDDTPITEIADTARTIRLLARWSLR
jgi:iron complex outermembrane receptor protein